MSIVQGAFVDVPQNSESITGTGGSTGVVSFGDAAGSSVHALTSIAVISTIVRSVMYFMCF